MDLSDQDLENLLNEALAVTEEQQDTVNLESEEQQDAQSGVRSSLSYEAQISAGLSFCARLGIHDFRTQEISKNSCKSDELWRGASLGNGVIQVESGPDIRRFNATLSGLSAHPQNNLAIFVGCFETEHQARAAKSMLENIFVTGSLESGHILAHQMLTMFHQAHMSSSRTLEQLREGLHPCSLCDILHCTLKCSACYEAHYCDINCQKKHWRSHKAYCKEKRKGRKEHIKAQKVEMHSEAKVFESLNETERPLTSGATDLVLQQRAREKIAVFQNRNLPFPYRITALRFFVASPEQWDAGEAVGYLPALVTLLSSEAAPDSSTPFDPSWLRFIQVNHVLAEAISGINLSSFRFKQNKHNAYKFLVETEGGWDSLLHGIHVMLRRAAAPLGGNGPCRPNGTDLKAYHDDVISVFRLLCELVIDHKIGRALAQKHFRITILRFRIIFADFLALENHPNYPLQHGFDYDDVEGLAFRVAGGIDTWCMREGLGNQIRKVFRGQMTGRGPVNAKEPFAAALGMSWKVRFLYEPQRRVSELGIDKGGVKATDAEAGKVTEEMEKTNPIMWAMARGLQVD